MEMYTFRLRFHWSLFLRVQLAIFKLWFRYWLWRRPGDKPLSEPWWLVYWRISVTRRHLWNTVILLFVMLLPYWFTEWQINSLDSERPNDVMEVGRIAGQWLAAWRLPARWAFRLQRNTMVPIFQQWSTHVFPLEIKLPLLLPLNS